jgi:hypothetical protein
MDFIIIMIFIPLLVRMMSQDALTLARSSSSRLYTTQEVKGSRGCVRPRSSMRSELRMPANRKNARSKGTPRKTPWTRPCIENCRRLSSRAGHGDFCIGDASNVRRDSPVQSPIEIDFISNYKRIVRNLREQKR